MKAKTKNHYRAHRLSFWLNLVPELHRPGGEDVPRSHHQLDPSDFSPEVNQVTTYMSWKKYHIRRCNFNKYVIHITSI